MSFESALEHMSTAIEHMAARKTLKYINYALVAGLVLASLLAVRETVKLAFLKPVASGPVVKDGAAGKDRQRPLSYYAPAVEHNVFGIEGQKLSEITRQSVEAAAVQEVAPVQVTPTVEIKLLGTVAWSDASGYVAVVVPTDILVELAASSSIMMRK